ncbi:hypothetical protein K466DRAFT_227607 [Polyporus arcularius HHB13444]|uniref:Secreted protein n=1 Tax=Polyporus arcularius HHB13444 TaxID=1314778 RepID=A0A5C3P3Y1_9APHY|nr:hypothetical protein K466DRAFT_227607 [Polyporus arcularius HHB13444]
MVTMVLTVLSCMTMYGRAYSQYASSCKEARETPTAGEAMRTTLSSGQCRAPPLREDTEWWMQWIAGSEDDASCTERHNAAALRQQFPNPAPSSREPCTHTVHMLGGFTRGHLYKVRSCVIEY